MYMERDSWCFRAWQGLEKLLGVSRNLLQSLNLLEDGCNMEFDLRFFGKKVATWFGCFTWLTLVLVLGICSLYILDWIRSIKVILSWQIVKIGFDFLFALFLSKSNQIIPFSSQSPFARFDFVWQHIWIVIPFKIRSKTNLHYFISFIWFNLIFKWLKSK